MFEEKEQSHAEMTKGWRKVRLRQPEQQKDEWILEAVENLKEKQRAHAEIVKRLEEAESAMSKLSEK